MNSFEDAKESGAAGDVGVLLGSAVTTTLLLSGLSGYRNAIDPSKGMPKWKIGLDAAVALAGIGGCFALDGKAAIAALGMGLAGACSVTSQYATVGGAYVAMLTGKAGPHPSPSSSTPETPASSSNPASPAVKGNEIHEGGVGSMTAKQRARYEAYMGR